ncbi:hypothetical protein GB937_009083 [Aspergillus fischeri]|nr:hypothetical protein GB937_009083 [Aspergillus fischeri]
MRCPCYALRNSKRQIPSTENPLTVKSLGIPEFLRVSQEKACDILHVLVYNGEDVSRGVLV